MVPGEKTFAMLLVLVFIGYSVRLPIRRNEHLFTTLLLKKKKNFSLFLVLNRLLISEPLNKIEIFSLLQGVSFIGWHQRTKLERVLLVTTAVLFVAVILTTGVLLTLRSPSYIPVLPCYQPEPKGMD